ncbi:MAG TPA: peptidylprolyl isomerase [Chitinophagaceae bacterium]|nr:peptidylprolyl isomerase [Chitinophagaceae bacterium]
MKKTFLLFVASAAITISTVAQTLFTYGNKKTEVNEFLQAYKKVYPEGSDITSKEKSVREYLELYINSKLKIQEAYVRKYDTQPEFIEELNNLRQQVMENYMTDPESYNARLNEAFERNQKDIQVQHIFIPYKTENIVSDSVQAKSKINEAYKELTAGKRFEEVALKFSADSAVAGNKGHLGFITVFTLPYQFENIIYGLTPGKFSIPFKSDFGYHIFKNIGERKAVGKIKAAHILLAIPAGSDEEFKTQKANLADSLYHRLLQGDDMAVLARIFSNDYISAASGGLIQEFNAGTYDPQFENSIIALSKDGDISKPFLTAHGYHIVKRIGFTAPPSEKTKQHLDEIRILLDKDPRVDLTRDLLIQRIMKKAGLRQTEINLEMLGVYIDSLADHKPAPPGNTLNNNMTLFKIGEVEKNIGDLVAFAQTNRWLPNFTGVKPISQLINEFKQLTVLDYYKKHMEELNADFKKQMRELKDGNLFFDIMMKEVWNRAQTDTAGQLKFYNQHLKKYTWEHSADAVIFYCSNEGTANGLREVILSNPAAWKQSAENFSDHSTTDSGRFELSKIPGLKSEMASAGMVTPIEKNKDDNSAAFAYVLNVYHQPAQKTFAEAKGEVISDYQEELDRRWVNTLKKKYPVVINQKVLSSILR